MKFQFLFLFLLIIQCNILYGQIPPTSASLPPTPIIPPSIHCETIILCNPILEETCSNTCNECTYCKDIYCFTCVNLTQNNNNRPTFCQCDFFDRGSNDIRICSDNTTKNNDPTLAIVFIGLIAAFIILFVIFIANRNFRIWVRQKYHYHRNGEHYDTFQQIN